jgi:hypothetical protein
MAETFTIPEPSQRHHLVGNPEATAWAVTDFEEHLWVRYPQELDMPMVFFLVIQPDGMLLPVWLPFGPEHLRAVPASVPARSRYGLFIGSVARQMQSLPPAKLADGTGMRYQRGQQLWFTAILHEAISIEAEQDPSFDVVKDFALDIPLERQHHIRTMFASDGLGNGFDVTREQHGTGPVLTRSVRFTPDTEKIAKYVDSPDLVAGALPWATAVMAMAFRSAFPHDPLT